jgi:hypothetical protein
MPARSLIACAVAVALCVLAAPAAAQVQPYRTGDFGGFHDILPPGANGRTNLVELAAFLATGARPRHNDDQLGIYARLLSATPGVTSANLGALFKDASFGSPPGGQARAYSPRAGVTITRDEAFGVPHVYATTRAAAMFGLGYAAAEDRLFFMDALRHAGRAARRTRSSGASLPTPRPTSSARPTSSTTSTATTGAGCRRTPLSTWRASTSTSPKPGSTSQSCPGSTPRSGGCSAPTPGR